MNVISDVQHTKVIPNNGSLETELDRAVLYNARLATIEIFRELELTAAVPAWLVKYRLSVHSFEAMQAFLSEICVSDEKRKWTGFETPKADQIKFGRLRHLLGLLGHKNFDAKNIEIMAARDEWYPNADMRSHRLVPILRCSWQLTSFDFVDDKDITADIWWLFVAS